MKSHPDAIEVRGGAPDRLAEAAEWFAILQDEGVTRDERRRWQCWLKTSEANRLAWARVEEIDRQFRGLPAEPGRQALKAAGRSRRRFLSSMATLAIAAPLGWATWQRMPTHRWRADVSTSVGQVRDITLPDGGHLWLNTGSAVQWAFGPEQRLITLLAGEALIHTAADLRPFRVQTPAGSIQPLGTRFSVRIEEDTTRVAVSAGRVAVFPAGQDAVPGHVKMGHVEATQVETGQAITFNARRIQGIRSLEPMDTAWQQGMLVADNMPLGDFLEQLARYRHGVIRYDQRAAKLKLVGAYPLADTDRILDVLENTLPVTVTRLTPWWVRVQG